MSSSSTSSQPHEPYADRAQPSLTFGEPDDHVSGRHVLNMIYDHWKTQLAVIQSQSLPESEFKARVQQIVDDIKQRLRDHDLARAVTVMVQHGEDMVPVVVDPMSLRAEFDDEQRPYVKIDVVRKI